MKKIALLALLLLGAGCGSPAAQRGVMVPFGNSEERGDVSTPIIPYQATSDLSRIAEMEAKEKEAPSGQYMPVEPDKSEPSTMNASWKFPGKLADAELLKKTAVLETIKGAIEFEIFGSEAPLASSNFIYLTQGGFYNGLTFHRREEGFVIQGGDPDGNGTGGPGYKFEDEPVKRSYDRGIVAMANSGPNTNGSQFFIMLGDVPLPPKYTIFGKVTKGMEVVDKIAVGDKMTKVTIK